MPRSVGQRHHRRGYGKYVVVMMERGEATGQRAWGVVSASTEPQALKVAHKKWGFNDAAIYKVPEGQSVSKTVDELDLDDEDRLAAPGEGGTRSFYAYYYNQAPSYGIFEPAARDRFARQHTRTAIHELGATKTNIRAWVRANDAALASGDTYRISEAARSSAPFAAEVGSTPELQPLREQLGQADIAGQRIIQARNQHDVARERREIQSAVRNVDALVG